MSLCATCLLLLLQLLLCQKPSSATRTRGRYPDVACPLCFFCFRALFYLSACSTFSYLGTRITSRRRPARLAQPLVCRRKQEDLRRLSPRKKPLVFSSVWPVRPCLDFWQSGPAGFLISDSGRPNMFPSPFVPKSIIDPPSPAHPKSSCVSKTLPNPRHSVLECPFLHCTPYGKLPLISCVLLATRPYPTQISLATGRPSR
ncbi:hypothetical protein B0H67DRAFT_64214 [Lasiosphaeris hirsuta]|uniref:Secreted protein n=1 Tax=Lasiosphaeris hirsuta TaxID=260670 RepID=A0AA40BBH4_9PEZI|nr:hypothetical protein B0H67DRAFT_64214 [Lasiosphaeris hirsuta]